MKSAYLPQVRLPLLAAALTLALAGCGDGAAPQATGPDADSSAAPAAPAAPEAAPPRFADGHDACFRAVAEQLGADTEVSEITSTFNADSGELQVCTVDYRNPADP